MKLSSKTKMIIAVGVVLLIALTILLAFCTKKTDNSAEDQYAYLFSNNQINTDTRNDYVAERLKVLENTKSQAQVISDVNTVYKKVSLTFDGMADADTMKSIAELLNKYGIKATFFLPGVRVAEEPSIAKDIVAHGFSIGNNTLTQPHAINSLTTEELIKEIYRDNTFINEQLGVTPVAFQFKGVEYTDNFRKIASACEIKYVVKGTYMGKISTSDQAANYVAKTSRGSVISVDTQAKDILKTLQKVIPAYVNAGFDFVDVRALPSYNDKDFTKDFSAARTEYNKATTFSFAHTTSENVALTFDGISNSKLVYKILDALDKSKIKATFFVSGYDALDNPKLVKEIIKRGHSIQNQGLTGKDISNMNYYVDLSFKRIYWNTSEKRKIDIFL